MVWLHALHLPLVKVVPAISLLALANAAHVPSSNGYYNVSGTDGSVIVIYVCIGTQSTLLVVWLDGARLHHNNG